MTHWNLIDCNAVALGVISKSREPMHSKPQLARRYLKTTVEDDSRRDRGWGNCVLTRPLFGKLSCYYPVRQGRKTCSVVELLHNGRHESD